VIGSTKLQRFAAVFASAFAIFYAAAVKFEIALFTVYPSLGVVLWGTRHSREHVDPAMSFAAPAMYWYGWLASAALAALLFGLVAVLLPAQWARKFWPDWVWLLPVAAMAACVYFSLAWFQL